MTEEQKTRATPDVAGLLALAGLVMLAIGLIVGFIRKGSCGSVLGGTSDSGYTSIDSSVCQVRMIAAQQWTDLLLFGSLLAFLAAAVVFALRPKLA